MDSYAWLLPIFFMACLAAGCLLAAGRAKRNFAASVAELAKLNFEYGAMCGALAQQRFPQERREAEILKAAYEYKRISQEKVRRG